MRLENEKILRKIVKLIYIDTYQCFPDIGEEPEKVNAD